MSARVYNNRVHSEARGRAVVTKEEAMIAKKISEAGKPVKMVSLDTVE